MFNVRRGSLVKQTFDYPCIRNNVISLYTIQFIQTRLRLVRWLGKAKGTKCIETDFCIQISARVPKSRRSHSLFSPWMILSQSSKHSPHGTQCGRSPVVPRAHLSHLVPVTPATHWHWPVRRSHCVDVDPCGLQSQAADNQTTKIRGLSSRNERFGNTSYVQISELTQK